MLKMSRGLYTGGNFKQNTWEKRREIGDLICDHEINDLVPTYFLSKYIMRSARTTTAFTFTREMVNFQKRDFYLIFLYTFTINCVTTGSRKKPIEYMFYFINRQQCIKSFRCAKCVALLVLYSRNYS